MPNKLKQFSKSSSKSFWLDAIMLTALGEIYIIDPVTLNFITASASALNRLNLDMDGMRTLAPADLFPEVSNEFLKHSLAKYKGKKQVNELISRHHQTNNSNLTDLRILFVKDDQNEVLVAIRRDQAAVKALDDSESRFQAIVSNIPGLVFQCCLNEKNEISFNYLSGGCKTLLGISSEELLNFPYKFMELILPEDRPLFMDSMQYSADNLLGWNWEGGIWIEEWHDIKLINLRASPSINSRGAVQFGGIMTNITQIKNEKLLIEQSHKLLAELSAHLATVKEEERHKIAREIHDDLGGNLTAIKIGLASLANQLDRSQHALIEKAKQLELIVNSTFDAAHRISSDLRPNILELGIVAAMEWQANQFEKQIGILCDFTTNDENISLDAEKSIVLFRVCQEALSNIAKHAKANLVIIKLTSFAHEINMQITDDGVGISAEAQRKKNAFGIRGMSERVTALKGSFSIQPGSSNGTEIVVKLPG